MGDGKSEFRGILRPIVKWLGLEDVPDETVEEAGHE